MASRVPKKTAATKKAAAKKPVLRKKATKAATAKPRAAKAAPKSAAKPTRKPQGKPRSKTGKQGVSRAQRKRDGKFLPNHSIGKETQFKAGQSGNPNGRKGSLADELRRKLPAVRVESDGRTNAGLVADALLEEAIEKRNVQAIREIFDRTEGKPRQTLDLTVIKSETEKYENMILQFIESSKADGFVVSREEAILYLSQHDPRILELFPLSSESTQ